MRFYLDECVSYRVLDPVREVFADHEFLDYVQTDLAGMKDIPLFAEMLQRHVDVFITLDRAQLVKPAEVEAIRAGGCHWVGFNAASGKGVSQVARTGAMLLETVAYILENNPDRPTAYRPKANGREGHQLFADIRPISAL